ncbi:MAG: DNA repair and recombination protein RadB [Candidatus Aenigmarchaeota archaeon]|nr:DNA repair and recombination protein RadB [Candidatus Aenigmarchaeota archaeon]
MRLATNTPLDKLLDGGIEDDVITNVYGPAGSGKTNIAIAAAINCSKKVVYLDTEGSFSLERFEQLGGRNLKNIMLINVHAWKEQCEAVAGMEKLAEKGDVGLVVVDSLVALYRLELTDRNYQTINKQLATQYSVLSKIARKFHVPVLVTNQVYSAGDEIELTSRAIAKYWSKALVELRKLEKENVRLAILRKHRSLPEGRKIEFEITGSGMKALGKFSIF